MSFKLVCNCGNEVELKDGEKLPILENGIEMNTDLYGSYEITGANINIYCQKCGQNIFLDD